MTRILLTGLVWLAAGSSALAVLPPIPTGVIFPPPAPKPADGEEADDVPKLADRIGKAAKGVGDKLGEQDTGDATRRDQAKLKQDLDKLIDLLQNQPPPPMSNDSSQQPPPPNGGQSQQPMGNGGGQSNQPMSNGAKSDQPKNSGGQAGQPMPTGGQSQPRGGSPRTGSGRRDRQPMPAGDQPDQQPMGNAGQPMPAKPDENGQPAAGAPTGKPPGGNQPGGGGKSSPTLPLAETIAKDFWGHLPEVPRQRMMQFFREQYNSRYKDLLPDYFSTLAEKEKKGKK